VFLCGAYLLNGTPCFSVCVCVCARARADMFSLFSVLTSMQACNATAVFQVKEILMQDSIGNFCVCVLDNVSGSSGLSLKLVTSLLFTPAGRSLRQDSSGECSSGFC